MQKIFIITLLFFTQMAERISAQPFEYIYSTPADEVINDLVQDSIGNYYMVGWKGTNSNNNYFGLIIKLSPQGDTLKTLIIPPLNNSLYLERITILNDSLLIIFGVVQMPSSADQQIYYLKIDHNLNILNEKTMGDVNFSETVMRANKSKQNEMLIAGFALSNNYQIIFYRISLDGDSLQSFYLGDSLNNEMGWDVLELPDTSGYFIFSIGWPSANPWTHNEIIKINNSGIVDTVVEIEDSWYILSAKWLNDSAFITGNSGYDPFVSPLHFDLRFRKYDVNLTLFADTLIGLPDTMEAEAAGPFDYINPDKIFAGGTANYQGNWFGIDPAYFLLIGFDNNLMPQWERIISHNDDYLSLYKVFATSDGGVLLAGTSYNDQTSGPNERDIYVIKLDSLGNFTTGINNPTATTQVHDVILYPNPAQDVINIRSTINFPATKIILFDASGREVMEKKFNKNASFSVKHLNAGIYFYKIKSAKGNEVRGKMVKK